LVRWDQDQIPSSETLGISTLVVPAQNSKAVQGARAQGYRVYLEVEAAALATFVPPSPAVAGVLITGNPSDKQLALLRQRLKPSGARALAIRDGAKWPHIRTNWVTKNREVLQVSSRTAQPWIENNEAWLRIMGSTQRDRPPILTYPWVPITLSDTDEGPALENYLVAIAEAGSFGGDLLLPLHERFQRNLLLGLPQARAEWNQIRSYLQFYASNLTVHYEPIVDVAVVTAEPMLSFEVMNLLARHNVPFELIAPARLPALDLSRFDLLIALDAPTAPQVEAMAAFARKGGSVVVTKPADKAPWRSDAPLVTSDERITYEFGEGRVVEALRAIADPNSFALEVRQLLGRERRVIDIWNGITVLTAPYQEPGGGTVLVTVLNYAHQPLPVQLRVRGLFSQVRYESPEEPTAQLAYQHRDGYTEFVLPALRIGGRVFLSRNVQ
ncbi:MAG: hypothetical protein ACRD15_19330, partial [Vicinamibacterales bacterium]